MYKRQAHTIFLLVYVDDIILNENSSFLIQQITTQLNSAFSLKQLGQLDYFLGFEIKYLPDRSFLMTQGKYIKDLLHRTHMAEAHSISSHMAFSCKLSKIGGDLFQDPTLYGSTVGALQYATLTRPKIAFVVNKVCQFMANPLDTH